jgi:Pentapeptide repeats (9 copies)
MAERTEVRWPTCEQAGCAGIRLPSGRMCLAHASEEETAAALKRVGETAVIDARGVPITGALLARILAAASRGENEQPLIQSCQFGAATFTGDARFDKVTFTGDALFPGATFTGTAWFGGATFKYVADFTEVTFTGDARFDGTTFTGDGTTFTGDARFDGATFERLADFSEATFTGDAWFDGVTFTGDALFAGMTFTGDDRFSGARFEQARQFGPLLAYRGLVLDDVQFAQPVQIEASSTGVCCRRAQFRGGVQFRLRWARVVLDDTDLAAPSILAGVPRLADEGWPGGRSRSPGHGGGCWLVRLPSGRSCCRCGGPTWPGLG